MDALLAKLLSSIRSGTKVCVAYSGGLDSSCLLHAVCDLQESAGIELRAIHVNHGMQSHSDVWQAHCEATCKRLEVPLTSVSVHLSDDASEEQARDARYDVFESVLQDGETLLFAHHQDDQLETMLLRLMRGAGPAGLAGMPVARPLGRGQLCRPWLDVQRTELQDYAERHHLDWIEDDSNSSNKYDRNFLRLDVLQQLEKRWPEYRQSWRKSQVLLEESAELLSELAALDLASAASEEAGAIEVPGLLALSNARRRNLLRHWFEQLGVRAPGWQQLNQLAGELLAARAENNPVIDLGDVKVQRFQNRLYALKANALADDFAMQRLDWAPQTQATLSLPGNGHLQARQVAGSGLALACADALQVRYREGGEALELSGRPNKPLKKLLQESAVPPWCRERLPLVYRGDELVCVPGIGVAASYLAAREEQGLEIDWQQPTMVLAARE